MGSTEVDQPKGIEVVKEAICKLKFNQQLRKSEGTKTPKVELTISIDGVAIQEPKTKTSSKVLQIFNICNIDVSLFCKFSELNGFLLADYASISTA